MGVILERERDDGGKQSTFQVFETKTFKVIYRYPGYFEHSIVQFSMLYKTFTFAIVFSNKPR